MRAAFSGAFRGGSKGWGRAARRAFAMGVVGAACLVPLMMSLMMPGAALAADTDQISPAEHLIFTTDHLHGVPQQTELDYALLSSDQPAHSTDVIRVLVVSADNAKGDAQVSDHSGAVPVPVGDLQCNPVIIYFLERDIADMEHLTGGQRRYFQQRLRLALAAGPKIETVTSTVNGKSVKAQQIVVQPYLNDPNAERFAQYTGKRYTFLLADTVPGQVALIRTDVPGANNDFAHPTHTETLSFQAAVQKMAPAPNAPNVPAKPGDAPRASR